ncbi:hypothetical protein DPMN_015899 [Dreissena polymorpha]|uniref:MAM domain-containing protein n=1 Tax=Dreissena polymorpha TaxID=45954 RepID=A0A9D4NCD7_DREPO|nr:hypothetical protein DPMN_015899 [Dreissena polymorpha]
MVLFCYTKVLVVNVLYYPEVTFEATVGDGYLGDIVLDDVSFTSATCPHTPNQATSSSGILIGR